VDQTLVGNSRPERAAAEYLKNRFGSREYAV
jgi:hypothetical protein